MIAYVCTQCRRELQAPREKADERGPCPMCGAAIVVPYPAQPAQALPVAQSGCRERWVVVLEEPGAINPAEHAGFLAEPMGLSPVDAAQVVRSSMGILSIGPEGSADGTVAALSALGVEAHAVCRSDLWQLPPTVRVRHVTWDADHVRMWQDDPRQAARFAWGDVLAVNCGHIVEVRTVLETQVVLTSAYGGASRVQLSHRKDRSDDFQIDIVSAEPPARLRLKSGVVDFSALGERRTGSARVNIRLLLALLVPAFHRAETNLRYQDVVLGPDGRPPVGAWDPPRYGSKADFDKATLWMTTLALVRQGAEGPSPSSGGTNAQ